MIKSFLISTFILLAFTIVESSILSNISFLYVVPDLVLICSVYFSLLNGKTYGELSGFVSGLFMDWITGIPFGFNCLYRTIAGYIFGLFNDVIIITGFIMPMLSVGAATILKTIFICIIGFLFPNVTGLISTEFLFEFIANIILAPFIFKLLDFFKGYICIISTNSRIDNV